MGDTGDGTLALAVLVLGYGLGVWGCCCGTLGGYVGYRYLAGAGHHLEVGLGCT